jgi:hypothetical protein
MKSSGINPCADETSNGHVAAVPGTIERLGLPTLVDRQNWPQRRRVPVRTTAEGFRYQRRQEGIEEDAALDGIYGIRTSVSERRLSAEQTVRTYKRPATVERAFRSLKSVDRQVRPIRHRLPDRVRAQVLICLLAYDVERHMRRTLVPRQLWLHVPRRRMAASRSEMPSSAK